MKTFIILFLLSISTASFAQITLVPDANFEQALIDLGIDSDGIINEQVLTSDINTLETLDVRYRNINNLTGIEDFTALKDLNVSGNNLTTLDTSANTQLITLICTSNPLNTINLLNNLNLEHLEISGLHQLDMIDLTNNTNLQVLEMIDCWIDNIDVSNNINLKSLIADGVPISEIDLSNNLALEYLDVTGVNLAELDVSNNVLLKELYCGNFDGVMGQEISIINLSNNVNLETFYAENLFHLETLNAKNGNNAILTITLPCEFEGVPCELTELNCVTVDDEVAATNDDPPYDDWAIDADFFYSENCALGVSSQDYDVFSIHPNPVKDNLFLNAKSTPAKLTVKIFNIEGKLLSTQNRVLQNQASIDVSQLSKGMYFLEVEDEKGKMEVKKFVKE